MIRTDGSGNELWSRTYGGDGNDGAAAGRILSDEGLVIGGGAQSFESGNRDYWLLRLNANGDSLWSRLYGGDFNQVLWTVAVTADGGYYLGGRGVPSEGASSDWCLIRTGPDPVSAQNLPHISLPGNCSLAAFPNPFNASTTLRYQMPRSGIVQLAVYDITGRLVSVITDQYTLAGTHSVRFDGSILPSGVFLARLRTAEWNLTQKLLLVR